MKKLMAAGLLTASLVGGTAGTAIYGFAAGAQDETTTTTEAPADASAKPERGDRVRTALQGLVDDGTLTAEQVEKVIEALDAARPAHGPRGETMTAVAEALNLEASELREKLQGGSTLAQIAEEQGVEVQTLIDLMVAEATEHIQQHVTDGKITQEQADTRIAELTERITDAANNGGRFGPGGRGEGGERGPRGDHGPRGGDADAEAPVEGDGASLNA